MSGPKASDEPVAVTDLDYTEASRELDAIVEFFEGREVDVDQLVARLERATAIVEELDRRIRRTRSQVEELVPRLEGALQGPAGADPPPSEDSGVQDEVPHEDEADEDEGERPLF